MEKEDVIQRAAFLIREEIFDINKNQFPAKLDIKDLLKGECSIPKILTNFYDTVLSGCSRRRSRSDKCQRTVKSLSQDLVYGVWNGKIKTQKHVCLGLALKSLTSSRKIVDIVNRYGHCVSYNVIEELETELTYSCGAREVICPPDIVRAPNLLTGLAFDNFDRFVDTLTGKDTLHDTVGIIFQEINDNYETEEEADIRDIDDNENNLKTSKRRRTYNVEPHSITPYRKKPKLVEQLEPIDTETRLVVPANLGNMKQLDLVWMFSHALKIPLTPMWVGFNSRIHVDKMPKQRVSYLAPINASPTNTSVIKETLIQTKQVARECNEPYVQVTYDLAIAKIAYQIQSTEQPEFDNVSFISEHSTS